MKINSPNIESSQLFHSSNSADVIFSQLSCSSSHCFNFVDVVSLQLHRGSSSADVDYSYTYLVTLTLPMQHLIS